ncbi:hypothetical protein C0995_002013 [Termitomyces sp. Mi166|nr:hypothetical protein C0995_002013 [Termitomyces sp. Mi166\
MEPFSSKSDRPRDTLLLTLHQRELAQKDQKIQRLQHANNESLKRQWEAQTRGNALAQSLGFRDVFEAQMAIDVAGQEVSYRECLERVVKMEEGMGEVTRANERLRERVGVLEGEAKEKRNCEELEKLQAENRDLLERIDTLRSDQACRDNEIKTTACTISRLEQELKQLQDRYDDLLDVKERAAERYKLDYARWKKVKEWIFDEGKQSDENKENEEGVSKEEKKRRLKKNIRIKKKMLVEIEKEGEAPTPSPFPKPPPLGRIENQTPPSRPKPAHFQSPTRRIPSFRNKLLDAVVHPKPPSSSPNLFNEGALSRSLPPKAQEPTSMSRNEGNSDPPSSPSPLDVDTRSSPTVVGTASKPLHNKLLDSVVRTKAAMHSSPTIPNANSNSNTISSSSSSSRKPLVFEPLNVVRPRSTSTHITQEIELRSSPSPPARKQDIAASSETEEDSQAVDDDLTLAPIRVIQPPSPSQRGPLIQITPTSPAPNLSSETEPDSQSQMFSLPFFDPTPCPARPSKPSLTQVHPSFPTRPALPRDRGVVSSRDEESLRARKVRRVGGAGDEDEDEGRTMMVAGPEALEFGVVGKEEGKGKGKERDPDMDGDIDAPSPTPANPPSTAQKRIEDYSVYKGRGRYGKNATSPKGTINAQFEINPTRNRGLDYQYDEVVRGRKDRKRMDAGDCECCRDYYEAVGPLPKRLQAPLWRSPPSTPAKSPPHFCPRHGSGSGPGSGSRSKSKSASKFNSAHSGSTSSSSTHKRSRDKENEITSHRQAISRHRYHWERPKTPPGYWNIGFPDTQETEDINERAREMHRRKREVVEREVERGTGSASASARGGEGRWRKRV